MTAIDDVSFLINASDAEAERYKREKAAKIESGQQIYARIKPRSKYYGQGERDALFPVYIEALDFAEAYAVQGGPGGQYRLSDVNLFIVDENGREMRIS